MATMQTQATHTRSSMGRYAAGALFAAVGVGVLVHIAPSGS